MFYNVKSEPRSAFSLVFLYSKVRPLTNTFFHMYVRTPLPSQAIDLAVRVGGRRE